MKLSYILDSKKIAAKIFFPRKTKAPPHDDFSKAFILKINDMIKIGGIFHINDPKLPTLLIFHGNAETANAYFYFALDYLACNVNLAVVDYRGYGFSNGEPTYKYLVKDSVPIYQKFSAWLDSQKFLNKIFVLGRSLGSVCAAEIGAQRPENLLGIIFESGFGDTYATFKCLFGITIEAENINEFTEWNNLPKIKKIIQPTLVIHGTKDEIIPIEQGRLIFKTLPPNTTKKLIEIKNANHNNIQDSSADYYPSIESFIKKFTP